MAIFRTQHNRENPYVMLNKGFLEDERLSAKAKGILAYLLSRPNGWEVKTEQLVKVMRDGRLSILTGLRELEEHNYFKRTEVRNPLSGRIERYVTDVFETPQTTEQHEPLLSQADLLSPQCGFPLTENPLTENRITDINNELVINEFSKERESSLSCDNKGEENPEVTTLLRAEGNTTSLAKEKDCSVATNSNSPKDQNTRRDNKDDWQQSPIAVYVRDDIVTEVYREEVLPEWAIVTRNHKHVAKKDFVQWFAQREGFTMAKAYNFLQKPDNLEITQATWEEYQAHIQTLQDIELKRAARQVSPPSSTNARLVIKEAHCSPTESQVTPPKSYIDNLEKLKTKQRKQKASK